MVNLVKEKRARRKRRIRGKVFGTTLCPRLCVFRSNDHIYGQIINDEKGITLVAASDKEFSKDAKNGAKKELAFAVGQLLAQKSLKKKIKKVVFDRGGFKYHGRVASLADGARKGGLEF